MTESKKRKLSETETPRSCLHVCLDLENRMVLFGSKNEFKEVEDFFKCLETWEETFKPIERDGTMSRTKHLRPSCSVYVKSILYGHNPSSEIVESPSPEAFAKYAGGKAVPVPFLPCSSVLDKKEEVRAKVEEARKIQEELESLGARLDGIREDVFNTLKTT
jgi:hypothetical protein